MFAKAGDATAVKMIDQTNEPEAEKDIPRARHSRGNSSEVYTNEGASTPAVKLVILKFRSQHLCLYLLEHGIIELRWALVPREYDFWQEVKHLHDNYKENEEYCSSVAGLVCAVGVKSCQDGLQKETGGASNVAGN